MNSEQNESSKQDTDQGSPVNLGSSVESGLRTGSPLVSDPLLVDGNVRCPVEDAASLPKLSGETKCKSNEKSSTVDTSVQSSFEKLQERKKTRVGFLQTNGSDTSTPSRLSSVHEKNNRTAFGDCQQKEGPSLEDTSMPVEIFGSKVKCAFTNVPEAVKNGRLFLDKLQQGDVDRLTSLCTMFGAENVEFQEDSDASRHVYFLRQRFDYSDCDHQLEIKKINDQHANSIKELYDELIGQGDVRVAAVRESYQRILSELKEENGQQLEERNQLVSELLDQQGGLHQEICTLQQQLIAVQAKFTQLQMEADSHLVHCPLAMESLDIGQAPSIAEALSNGPNESRFGMTRQLKDCDKHVENIISSLTEKTTSRYRDTAAAQTQGFDSQPEHVSLPASGALQGASSVRHASARQQSNPNGDVNQMSDNAIVENNVTPAYAANTNFDSARPYALANLARLNRQPSVIAKRQTVAKAYFGSNRRKPRELPTNPNGQGESIPFVSDFEAIGDQFGEQEQFEEAYDSEEEEQTRRPRFPSGRSDQAMRFLQVLPYFSGDGKDVRIKSWLTQYEWIGEQHGWTAEDMLCHFQLRLTGTARTAYFNLGTHERRSYDLVRRAMVQLFKNEESDETIMRNLLQCKQQQNETVNAYASRLRMLYNQALPTANPLGAFTAVSLLHQFIAGLRQEFQEALTRSRPDTFDKAWADASAEEDALSFRVLPKGLRKSVEQSNRRLPTTACPKCHRPGHWARDCTFKKEKAGLCRDHPLLITEPEETEAPLPLLLTEPEEMDLDNSAPLLPSHSPNDLLDQSMLTVYSDAGSEIQIYGENGPSILIHDLHNRGAALFIAPGCLRGRFLSAFRLAMPNQSRNQSAQASSSNARKKRRRRRNRQRQRSRTPSPVRSNNRSVAIRASPPRRRSPSPRQQRRDRSHQPRRSRTPPRRGPVTPPSPVRQADDSQRRKRAAESGAAAKARGPVAKKGKPVVVQAPLAFADEAEELAYRKLAIQLDCAMKGCYGPREYKDHRNINHILAQMKEYYLSAAYDEIMEQPSFQESDFYKLVQRIALYRGRGEEFIYGTCHALYPGHLWPELFRFMDSSFYDAASAISHALMVLNELPELSHVLDSEKDPNKRWKMLIDHVLRSNSSRYYLPTVVVYLWFTLLKRNPRVDKDYCVTDFMRSLLEKGKCKELILTDRNEVLGAGYTWEQRDEQLLEPGNHASTSQGRKDPYNVEFEGQNIYGKGLNVAVWLYTSHLDRPYRPNSKHPLSLLLVGSPSLKPLARAFKEYVGVEFWALPYDSYVFASLLMLDLPLPPGVNKVMIITGFAQVDEGQTEAMIIRLAANLHRHIRSSHFDVPGLQVCLSTLPFVANMHQQAMRTIHAVAEEFVKYERLPGAALVSHFAHRASVQQAVTNELFFNMHGEPNDAACARWVQEALELFNGVQPMLPGLPYDLLSCTQLLKEHCPNGLPASVYPVVPLLGVEWKPDNLQKAFNVRCFAPGQQSTLPVKPQSDENLLRKPFVLECEKRQPTLPNAESSEVIVQYGIPNRPQQLQLEYPSPSRDLGPTPLLDEEIQLDYAEDIPICEDDVSGRLDVYEPSDNPVPAWAFELKGNQLEDVDFSFKLGPNDQYLPATFLRKFAEAYYLLHAADLKHLMNLSDAREELITILRERYPQADFYTFGSVAQGLASATSDIDLGVITHTEAEDEKDSPALVLHRMRHFLATDARYKQRFANNVSKTLILLNQTKTKSVLSLIHKDTKVVIDVVADGEREIDELNTGLVHAYVRLNHEKKVIPQILFLFRGFVKEKKFDDARKCGMASFATAMVALTCLQKIGFVPKLQQLKQYDKNPRAEFWTPDGNETTEFKSEYEVYSETPEVGSVFTLLLAQLDELGTTGSVLSPRLGDIVSTYHGSIAPRLRSLRENCTCPLMESPFNQATNTLRSVKKGAWHAFKEVISRTCRRLAFFYETKPEQLKKDPPTYGQLKRLVFNQLDIEFVSYLQQQARRLGHSNINQRLNRMSARLSKEMEEDARESFGRAAPAAIDFSAETQRLSDHLMNHLNGENFSLTPADDELVVVEEVIEVEPERRLAHHRLSEKKNRTSVFERLGNEDYPLTQPYLPPSLSPKKGSCDPRKDARNKRH